MPEQNTLMPDVRGGLRFTGGATAKAAGALVLSTVAVTGVSAHGAEPEAADKGQGSVVPETNGAPLTPYAVSFTRVVAEHPWGAPRYTPSLEGERPEGRPPLTAGAPFVVRAAETPVAAPKKKAATPTAPEAVRPALPSVPASVAPEPPADDLLLSSPLAPEQDTPPEKAPTVEAPAAPVAQPAVQTVQPPEAKTPAKAVQAEGFPQTASAEAVSAVAAEKAEPAPKPAANGSAVAAAALGQIGVSQDCTGLVSNALAAVGISHYGWPASYLGLGRTISGAEAQPGDLIYYADGGTGLAHVAVYLGNGQAVHGGWNGGTTAVASANVGSGPVFIRL